MVDKYIKFFVTFIFFFAVVLRFWQLGSVPTSLNWDEVAFGYNAYALGIDGRDEFGRLLPYAYLESYGDYKPPLYAYLTVVPVWLFGLNEFSVRFASAFFGSLTVLVGYFLTRRIFASAKESMQFALITMLLLAISPWHINLSRAAYEANVATFLIVTGVWLFLEAVQGRRWLFTLPALSFSLSLFTFNTSRIVVPLLVLVLAIVYHKILLKSVKQIVPAIVVGAIITLPLVPFLLSPQAGLRFKEVNIFSDTSLIERANQEVANDNGVFWSKVLHNRRVIFAQEYFKHYFDNFNPNFIFISGDENHRFSTKDVGLLYFFEIPFVVIGFIYLLRRRESNWWIIPAWLFIGVIPAATARETPHALRIETVIPTLQIISAVGIVTVAHLIIRMKILTNYKMLLGGVFAAIIIFHVAYYIHGYYAHYSHESAGEWQYGYKDAVAYAHRQEGSFDHIVMTKHIGRPYAYMLFYTKTHPDDFRNKAEVERDVFGFVNVPKYDKYIFTNDVRGAMTDPKKTLYIDVPENVPDTALMRQQFRYPDGYLRLVAYTL